MGVYVTWKEPCSFQVSRYDENVEPVGSMSGDSASTRIVEIVELTSRNVDSTSTFCAAV